MMNAASTSNPSSLVEVGQAYPYPSHFVAPNFVTMKLSGNDTYNVWETQILCLLESHQMYGFIDGQFPRPAGNGKEKVGDLKAWIISDSLVKGWILGSLSDGVAKKVVNRLKPKRMVDMEVVDMEAWVASDSLVKGWILGPIPEDAEAVNHLTHKENNTDFSSKDLWDELRRTYGPSAASTSNPSIIVDVGEAYPHPSLIAANFVTVKLSGKNKYNLWETQMLCLLKSHQMYGFIDGQFPRPAGNGKGKAGDLEAWIISDWLVKGWILGSLSEEAARKAVNHLKHKKNNTDFTAKDLWDELQRSYGPSVREQAAETKVTTRQAESLIEDAKSKDEPTGLYEDYKKRRLYKSVLKGDTYWTAIDASPISEDAKSKDEPIEEKTKKEKFDEIRDKYLHKRWLYETILEGETDFIKFSFDILGLKPWDKLANNGNTVLHVAVASSTKNHELLEKLLEKTPEEYKLLDLVNSDGSTLLHVAAIGDNIKAVNLLVERNRELLLGKDKENHTPLALSVSNMHTKTSHCLFEHIKEKGYGSYFSGKSGEEIVVLAISCQDFRLANMIIKDYSDAILPDSDAVLTALAQNFPRELNFWERGWKEDYYRIIAPYSSTADRLWSYLDSSRGCQPLKIFIYFFIVLCLVATMFYGFLKMFVRLVLEDTFHIHEDATNLLSNVCEKIRTKYKSSTYPQYYTTTTFEATRRNTSTFIRCIMKNFSDAIWGTNEDGHNFIQYSVINRSEKIYNLLYEMSEHKNIYKTIKDASGNNLLHLAARLAPTNKLNLISGAALQIQRELQWFKEVERFVCPLCRIQKNSDDETPEMVFIREHKDLVNEGEKWIKKTAESYTITAALIITIVFAAAITVPGGNNQESGIPIFTNDIAFTVFAISDAISLFTAVTSLLMFLSILTARFSEQDFLFKLPTKLIIGLAMLFLSTTAMIIAFGATLFLVFGQSNSPMLIPIGALTCLPVTSFMTLQFPLIVDLIRATYCGGFFVRERYEYFY